MKVIFTSCRVMAFRSSISVSNYNVTFDSVLLPKRISMPASRQHHSCHDSEYETRMQNALAGLHSGKYFSITKAAQMEGIKCFCSFFE